MKPELIHLLSANKPANWLRFFYQHGFRIPAELEKKITQIKSVPDMYYLVTLVTTDDDKQRDQVKSDGDMSLEVALMIAQELIKNPQFLPEVFRVLIPLADSQIEILRALEMISEIPKPILPQANKRKLVAEAYLLSSEKVSKD